MSKRAVAAVVAVTCVAACSRRTSPSPTRPRRATGAAATATLAIVGARVVSMDRDGALDDHTILVAGDRITALGPSVEIEVPATAEIVDARGRTVIPGLIDSHVHLFDLGDLTLYLAHGVTTVVNMSGSRMHLRARAAIREGTLDGPILVTTGPQLKVDAVQLVEFEENATTPEQARAAVRGQATAGYDFVKVWGALDPAVYEAVASEAAAAGVRVTGHIPRAVGLDGVLDAGQSIGHIEQLLDKHLSIDATPGALAVAAERIAGARVPVMTTLVTQEALAASVADDPAPLLSRPGRALLDPVRQMMWEPEMNRLRRPERVGKDAQFRERLAVQQRIASALSAAGVPLLAGSDAGELPGVVPGLDLHRELSLLVDAGLSPQQALRAATSAPGRYLFGDDDVVGVIRVGARADLLLLDGDPLADIADTRRIAGVIARGRHLPASRTAGMLDELAGRNRRTAVFVDAVLREGAAGGRAVVDRFAASGEPAFAMTPALFLALGLASRGDAATALAVLEQVAQVYPRAPEPLYIAAGAALAAGDRDAAIAGFRRVLERAPDHDRAQRALERVESGASTP